MTIERHIIDEKGNYVVQIYRTEPTPLAPGEIQVPPRPEYWYEWINGQWQENATTKYHTLSERTRDQRNFLLIDEVDPVVTNPLRWDDLSESQQQAVIDYRRSLLDITDQPGFPFAVTWPEKPQI
jgi:hypothetical protein